MLLRAALRPAASTTTRGMAAAASATPLSARPPAASSATPLSDRPPAAVGDPVSAIETPALVVDLAAFDANCARLAKAASAWPALRLRPHFKAHKTPELAVRAAVALGPQAVGISAQKVGEAEVALGGGVPGSALVTNEICDPARLARLAALAASAPGRVGLAVDCEAGVDAAAEAARAAGTTLGVVVDVDVGQARCGAPDPSAAAALAARVRAAGPALSLWGVQAYHGGIQHIRSVADRRAAVERVAAIARAAGRAVSAAVASTTTPLTITGGGTGTWALDAAAGALTEVQPGSFAFGDADYGRNEDGGDWAQALWVLSQVMSMAPGVRSVVDAGLKAVDVLSGPPVPAGCGAGLAYAGAGDEHGILTTAAAPGPVPPEPPAGLDPWPAGTLPPLGAKLWLQPGHCDPTVNLYDWIVGVEDGVVREVWRVAGRGPGV